jgi:hypothetical protein
VQEAGHHPQVLRAGEQVVDGGVLPGEADRAPDADRVGQQVMAGHRGGARVRPDQRGENADQGGLARAVRPEQGDDRSGVDGKIYPVEDDRAAEGLA